MLSQKQAAFSESFLSPHKQRHYYLKNLPMVLFSGIRLIHLDEVKSVSVVPYWWLNINPFHSMCFAVQSTAAELSTAAPIMLVLKGADADLALIIVNLKVDFVKKEKSRITFTCMDYEKFYDTIAQLEQAEDTAAVTTKTIGRDADGNEVATFYFTRSFKRRS